MYVSWNDFGTSCGAGGCLFATFSSDGGATWSTPVEVQTDTSIFNRDVQITGDMAGGGAVYIAGMDEGGGGFPHNNTNYIFKSTDGGVSWTNTYVGAPFPGPGVCSSGTSPGCLALTAATGGTRAGVSLLRSAISFTWSMTSRAPAVTRPTSITFAPRMAV